MILMPVDCPPQAPQVVIESRQHHPSIQATPELPDRHLDEGTIAWMSAVGYASSCAFGNLTNATP